MSFNPTFSLPWGLRSLRRLPIPHKLGFLDRLYGNHLAKSKIQWIETANGPIWKLDLRNPTHRWIVYGDYQGPTGIGWMKKWLAGGGNVVDSGANIGQTVLYFASLPGTKVYAFEPFLEAANWLEECLKFQTGWQVQVIHSGLHSYTDDLELIVPEIEGAHGAQSTLCTEWYKNRARKVEEINVTRLDDFMERKGIHHVRLWKLDVEGWEVHAINGASSALEKQSIDAIFAEVAPVNFPDIRKLCNDFNYRIYLIDNLLQLKLYNEQPEKKMDFVLLAHRE